MWYGSISLLLQSLPMFPPLCSRHILAAQPLHRSHRAILQGSMFPQITIKYSFTNLHLPHCIYWLTYACSLLQNYSAKPANTNMMPSAAEHQCNLKLCSPDLCQHWVLPQAPPLRGGFISGPLIFCPALPPPEQTRLWGHSVTMNPTLCGSRDFAGWWWAHLSVFIWRKGFCKTLFSLKGAIIK